MGDDDDPVAIAAPPMTSVAPETQRYDDVDGADLVRLLCVPRVAVYGETASTMDVAHVLAAAGAPAGTIVLADRQTAGRGRGGRAWLSEAGAGIWLTLIERPEDGRAIEVLALRVGLYAARILDHYAGSPVGLKWPNDLLLGKRKLAGVLIEARWQDGALQWVAIGLGVNVRAPLSMAAARRPVLLWRRRRPRGRNAALGRARRPRPPPPCRGRGARVVDDRRAYRVCPARCRDGAIVRGARAWSGRGHRRDR